MMKNKLYKSIPALLILGVIVTTAMPVSAIANEKNNYKTSVELINNIDNTMIVENDENIDSEMLIKQEIYVNSKRYPDFGVHVFNNKTFLPLEVITEKMGNRLEGGIEGAFYLRKDDKMLIVIPNENIYILNGEKHTLDSRIINNHLYVPLDFFKDILNYEMIIDGNSVYIGDMIVICPEVQDEGEWILENGKWSYINNGNRVKGWLRNNYNYYYLNAEGIMETGWIKENNKWYFMNENGAMQTGWITNNGSYYYLNETGEMASNTTIDGFILAENGICISLYAQTKK